jgi:uncharacterized ion transporter superfamily protein YfcC
MPYRPHIPRATTNSTMSIDFTIHLLVDAIIFVLSVATTVIVSYFRRLFKGSIFERSWNFVQLSAIFLFAGVLVDLILMGVYGATGLWMRNVKEAFMPCSWRLHDTDDSF